jgi:hypothetical protein
MNTMSPSEKPNIYLPAEQMAVDIEYKTQALEHLKEQRTFIKQQSRNATITLWATIFMALATCVIAYFAYTQNNLSSKIAEYKYERTQVPILQSK